MSTVSRPLVPYVVAERIKEDACKIRVLFYTGANPLDVFEQQFEFKLFDKGITLLKKPNPELTRTARNEVEILLTDADKSKLSGKRFTFSLSNLTKQRTELQGVLVFVGIEASVSHSMQGAPDFKITYNDSVNAVEEVVPVVRGIQGPEWINWTGAFVANKAYKKGDGASNGGNSYRRKADGSGGAAFEPTQWDLIAQGGFAPNGSIKRETLAEELKAVTAQVIDSSTAFVYAITDSSNKVVFGVRSDGTVWLNPTSNLITASQLVDGAVTFTKLSQTVKDLYPVTVDTVSTGWAWTLTDANGRIALGVRLNGTVYANGITAGLLDNSVTYAKLETSLKSLLPWYGKKGLCIGDSVTAAGQYQTTLAERTGLTITTHAKGGIGLVQMVDGDGATSNPIAALTAAQLQDKDIVTIFGSLNDRSNLVGTRADLYPNQTTVYGRLNYVIQKVFSLAASANRKDIRIVLIAPHKVGKYSYIDADGATEYPAGSGQTLETIVNAIKDLGGLYGLPVIDLYHNSGINQFNWDILTVNTISSGGPYPANPDNVHPNAVGHAQLGRYMASQINRL